MRYPQSKQRFKSIIRIFITVAAVQLLACGGGGSGSSADSRSARSAETGLRIIHASLDLGQLDLTNTETNRVVAQSKFAKTSYHGEVNEGLGNFALTLHNASGDRFGSFTLDIDKRDQWSIFVYGDQSQLGIRTTLLDDTKPERTSNTAQIRVLHGLVGANRIQIESETINTLSGIGFGQASGWIEVPVGAHDIGVYRAVDRRLIGTARINAENQQAYTVVVGGDLELYPVVHQFQES